LRILFVGWVVSCVVMVIATLAATLALTMPFVEDLAVLRDWKLKQWGAAVAAVGKEQKEYFSRGIEEQAIRDFFKNKRDGVFVDIGANHYRDESNTYFLEKQLGWSGIAVDALEEFAEGYRQHRPATRFFAAFVGDRNGAMEDFFLSKDNLLVASSDKQFVERQEGHLEKRQIPTITLDALLDREGVRQFDLLSIDIELAEPLALAGFDIDRFRPKLVCIEAHPEVRQRILDYFARHRYVLVGKYLRVDGMNLYFTPLETAETGPAPSAP
jgi:FkbM family methyltransferase